jgi:hypothetical protein
MELDQTIRFHLFLIAILMDRVYLLHVRCELVMSTNKDRVMNSVGMIPFRDSVSTHEWTWKSSSHSAVYTGT